MLVLGLFFIILFIFLDCIFSWLFFEKKKLGLVLFILYFFSPFFDKTVIDLKSSKSESEYPPE